MYVVDQKNQMDKFRIGEGLNGIPNTVSFRSVEYTAHYLRNSWLKLYMHRYSSDEHYKKDAAFFPRLALNGGSGYSFESVNYRNRYIRQGYYQIKLDYVAGASEFGDASWTLCDKEEKGKSNNRGQRASDFTAIEIFNRAHDVRLLRTLEWTRGLGEGSNCTLQGPRCDLGFACNRLGSSPTPRTCQAITKTKNAAQA